MFPMPLPSLVHRTVLALGAIVACAGGADAETTTPATASDLTQIDHVVVIYQENWSFDGQYGQFPGAEGFAFGRSATQADAKGALYTALPHPLGTDGKFDTVNFIAWPDNQPVAFYDLLGKPFTDASDVVSAARVTGELVHAFYTEQWQIDGGRNDRFVAGSTNPGLVLSGFDATRFPEGALAREFTLCDHCFHSAFGGSFLNHQFLIAGQAPLYGPVANGTAPIPVSDLSGYPATVTMPTSLDAPTIAPTWTVTAGKANLPLGSLGNLWPPVLSQPLAPPGVTFKGFSEGQLLSTDDARDPALGKGSYYCVNTMYPPFWPFPTKVVNGSTLPRGSFTPPLRSQTIGDLLSAHQRSWAWYSEGWDDAVAGNPDANFQYHHQPFNYFANFAPGTPGRQHLQDFKKLLEDINQNTIPDVAFVKFLGRNNEHPGYADIIDGQTHVAELVEKIRKSPAWSHTVIIITYDEHGGRWDHVNPLTYPNADRWGPGLRVPCIIVSPFAKRHFVDTTPYETESILSLIEKRWGLGRIVGANRDGTADPFSHAFE